MNPLYTQLESAGQRAFVERIRALPSVQQRAIAEQLSSLDLKLLAHQRQQLTQAEKFREVVEPLRNYQRSGSIDDQALGREGMRSGRCGCILVAGGQGTRLGFNGPKGRFPISFIKNKSLFQLYAEKVVAAGRQVGHPLPLAIMTSLQNDRDTREFFQKNTFFGLEPHQVAFFSQGDLPLLNDKGELLLDEEGRLAMGPDGNGSCLYHFVKSGIAQRWHNIGIDTLSFVLIDNALGDPYDAELLGFHMRTRADVTIKAVERRDPQEKVGVLVIRGDKTDVVEYTEMPESERIAVDNQGQLKHRCANLSLFCFSMPFVFQIADKALPLHLAHKSLKTASGPVMAWKFERFIFDILPFAQRTEVLVYERSRCFAPLKNATGSDSVKTVQEALLAYDRNTFAALSGVPVGEEVILELSPQFYYPTDDLRSRWRGKEPPSGYVDCLF